MGHRIRAFFGRSAETIKITPVESLLAIIFMIYGFISVAADLSDGQAARMLLFPFGFTLAYILNYLLPGKPLRWVYLLSPLVLAPFLWCDMAEWLEMPEFWTALGLCIAALLLFRWRRDNTKFVSDVVRYVVNGFFSWAISGIAFLLLMAIYYSLKYIFPELPLGDPDDVMPYFSILLFAGVMPLLFLTLDRSQHEDVQPVRIVDILVNYVLTPALMIYTVILYAYFITIVLGWSLPKGGIAYMVFAFTIIAVVVKAYLPLTGKRFMGWFYDYFHLISLPALAMFWIGVLRRVSDYGFTTSRVYLLICGIVMTFTVLMFLIPRIAKYRYPVLGGALLFSLAAFIPGITAWDIGLNSQRSRFEAAAACLGITDDRGKIILEKRPDATDEQQNDYRTLRDAFDYICDHDDEKDVEERYGISSVYTLQQEVLPDNVDYSDGYVHVYNDNIVYLRNTIGRPSIDLKEYSSMHQLTENGMEDDSTSYHYTVTSEWLTVYTPQYVELLRRPLDDIFRTQLRKAGINPDSTFTDEQLREAFPKMLFYEEDDCALLFESMDIDNGTTPTLDELDIEELFLK